MSGEVVVYGATGFTGRLAAHAVERAGMPMVLAGRNRDSLEELSRELGGEHEIAVASHDDPDALSWMLAGTAALISTAGPFMEVGELVVAAAVERGVHYVDSTGEVEFMAQTHRRHDAAAREKDIAVVNACAFEYALGDCAVALALEDAPDAESVRASYYIPDKAVTRGTATTVLRALSGSASRRHKSEAAQVDFPEPVGRQWAVSHPGGEEEFLRRRRPDLKVRNMMNMPALAARTSAAMPVMASVLGLAPVRRAIEAGIKRMPAGPDVERRAAQEFVILVEVDPGEPSERRLVVSGVDPYGLTAEILARHASRLVAGKKLAAGVLSPAQALDPGQTLDSLADLGVRWEKLPPS